MSNPLLESQLPLRAWISKLSGVSMMLYEAHGDVWEQFEPERKRLVETLSWLDSEGEVDLSATTATEAIRVLEGWNSKRGDEWHSVADLVGQVFTVQLASIFERSR